SLARAVVDEPGDHAPRCHRPLAREHRRPVGRGAGRAGPLLYPELLPKPGFPDPLLHAPGSHAHPPIRPRPCALASRGGGGSGGPGVAAGHGPGVRPSHSRRGGRPRPRARTLIVTVPPAAAQAACWLEEAVEAIRRIDAASVAAAAELLLGTRRAGGTIFVAGNGGSAAAASHLALDLQKAGRAPGGKGTPALSLSDSMGLVTAWGNDTAFERVFAEQLEVLGKPGD